MHTLPMPTIYFHLWEGVPCEDLLGLKENVIVGHKIPAGTGMRDYETMIVGSKSDYNRLVNNDDAIEAESTVGTLNS